LFQFSTGEELPRSVHVDHRNDDPFDDRLENLQALSAGENISKSAKPAEVIIFVCPVCGLTAQKRASKVRHNRKQAKAGPFCGKKCSRAWQIETLAARKEKRPRA
jgi:predicted RNA-binding Zn-ribbon protein involved in translation (DUF1610 family)